MFSLVTTPHAFPPTVMASSTSLSMVPAFTYQQSLLLPVPPSYSPLMSTPHTKTALPPPKIAPLPCVSLPSPSKSTARKNLNVHSPLVKTPTYPFCGSRVLTTNSLHPLSLPVVEFRASRHQLFFLPLRNQLPSLLPPVQLHYQ